jgi:hypothetical protein
LGGLALAGGYIVELALGTTELKQGVELKLTAVARCQGLAVCLPSGIIHVIVIRAARESVVVDAPPARQTLIVTEVVLSGTTDGAVGRNVPLAGVDLPGNYVHVGAKAVSSDLGSAGGAGGRALDCGGGVVVEGAEESESSGYE